MENDRESGLAARIRRELPRLSTAEATLLARIVDLMVDAYAPQRVYLFGSKARGDSGADSDFDLMIVVSDTARSELKSSRLAYERLWRTGAAADVLVWTESRFDSRVHLKASLPGTILREGRLLYAA